MATNDLTTPYDVINDQDQPFLAKNMDDLAREVESRNYGAIRFLAALVRVMMKSEKRKSIHHDTLLQGLIKLISQGIH